MRHYHDYKTHYRFLKLILVLGLLITPILFTHAQSAKDIQEKIDEKTDEIERLEREIKGYQSELTTLGAQKSSLAGEIKQLDLTKKKLNADISVTENKIDQTNLKIGSLSKDIVNKEDSISNNLQAIAEGIRSVNEFEHSTLVEVMLSDVDFASAWNDIDNTMTVREAVRDNIEELREVKTDLEVDRDATTKAKNELVALRTKLSDQKKIVEQNTAQKNKLLSQTQNSEANYQKILAAQVALKAAIEAEVENYEAQLKFVLNPSTLPSGRVLSWPLDSIFVTSPYAPRWGGFHRGTDFRAAVGTPAKAMADGVILGVGNTDLTCPKASFGGWVAIKFDNGLSATYGHLSLVKVSKGQRVSRGQVVAYTGNTGSSTGPHLHVSLYAPTDAEGNPGVSVKTIPSKSCAGKTLTQPIAATNAYLDPMVYLPSI